MARIYLFEVEDTRGKIQLVEYNTQTGLTKIVNRTGEQTINPKDVGITTEIQNQLIVKYDIEDYLRNNYLRYNKIIEWDDTWTKYTPLSERPNAYRDRHRLDSIPLQSKLIQSLIDKQNIDDNLYIYFLVGYKDNNGQFQPIKNFFNEQGNINSKSGSGSNTFDGEIMIPMIPDEMGYNYSANFSSQPVLGRVSPLHFYSSGSSEVVSFSVKLNEDLINYKGHGIYASDKEWISLSDYVENIRRMSYPVIDIDGRKIFPVVYFQLGSFVAKECHVETTVSWEKPIRDGKYTVVNLGFTVTIETGNEQLLSTSEKFEIGGEIVEGLSSTYGNIYYADKVISEIYDIEGLTINNPNLFVSLRQTQELAKLGIEADKRFIDTVAKKLDNIFSAFNTKMYGSEYSRIITELKEEVRSLASASKKFEETAQSLTSEGTTIYMKYLAEVSKETNPNKKTSFGDWLLKQDMSFKTESGVEYRVTKNWLFELDQHSIMKKIDTLLEYYTDDPESRRSKAEIREEIFQLLADIIETYKMGVGYCASS